MTTSPPFGQTARDHYESQHGDLEAIERASLKALMQQQVRIAIEEKEQFEQLYAKEKKAVQELENKFTMLLQQQAFKNKQAKESIALYESFKVEVDAERKAAQAKESALNKEISELRSQLGHRDSTIQKLEMELKMNCDAAKRELESLKKEQQMLEVDFKRRIEIEAQRLVEANKEFERKMVHAQQRFQSFQQDARHEFERLQSKYSDERLELVEATHQMKFELSEVKRQNDFLKRQVEAMRGGLVDISKEGEYEKKHPFTFESVYLSR